MVDEARFERDGITYSVGAKDADGRYIPVGPNGKPLGAASEDNSKQSDDRPESVVQNKDAEKSANAGDMTVNELDGSAGNAENVENQGKD